jgi:hypothetical protein
MSFRQAENCKAALGKANSTQASAILGRSGTGGVNIALNWMEPQKPISKKDIRKQIRQRLRSFYKHWVERAPDRFVALLRALNAKRDVK